MRKKMIRMIWMLAILMQSVMAVSCSNDEDQNEPYMPYLGVPQVPFGDPVDIETLPEELKYLIILAQNRFILLEGTWLGQHAYWFMASGASTYPNFFYMEDGTKSYYIHDKVDWSTWRCTYDYYKLF